MSCRSFEVSRLICLSRDFVDPVSAGGGPADPELPAKSANRGAATNIKPISTLPITTSSQRPRRRSG